MCYNCSEMGHIARNCPYPQKGYGKGKGNFKGYQGQQKGWGKGIHEFGYPPAHPMSPYAQNYGGDWGQQSAFSLGGGINPNMVGEVSLETPHRERPWENEWGSSDIEKDIETDTGAWNTVSKNKRGRTTHSCCPSVDLVSLEEERQIGGVNNNFRGEWEVIKVTVDSGAVDTVTPPSTAKYFPILETEASRRGLHYRAANGTRITNHGARRVQGISAEFKPMDMIMNVADVKKTLASAFQIVNANNKVVLDKDYSYIVNKETGERTTITLENGEFNFDLWVPAPNPGQPPLKYKDGIFAALQEEEPEDAVQGTQEPFTRQGVRF